jgi:uncharacterized hydrophobic protein (TIGR00271 family)
MTSAQTDVVQRGVMGRASEFLHGGAVDAAEIQRVRDVLLFEGADRSRRISRFFMLLILASAIATYGLLSNSIATVIGAMIVAPLMLPIMGLAFGVSLGDRRAIMRSLVISILGIGTAIAVGWVLTRGFSSVIDVTSNSQIMSRTSPRLIDLLAALATGLAGAYATGRKDVSDTLPGVAIAISLVPPLANVGILLATGHPDLAKGSMLLFVTNYLAILLTGALMFAIMGYPAASHAEKSRRARITVIAVALVLGLVIIVPLAYTSLLSIATNFAQDRSSDAAKQWVKGSDYRVASVQVTDGKVLIVVAGQGQLPPQQKLEDSLRGKLYDMPVTLEVVPETRTQFQTTNAGGQ